MRHKSVQTLAAVAATGAMVGGFLGIVPASASAAGTFPQVLKEGGSLTVLEGQGGEGAWPQGLDPATDGSAGANQDMEDAIFGNLFELGPTGATVPDLATGYKISEGGKTYSISIRPGVTFSDGTPLDAAAVVDNWRRDFKLKGASLPTWPVASFATAGPETAVINLKTPYSPLINSMHDSNVNWMVSPTALAKLGTKAFAISPVGAGPFMVQSDTVSTDLALKKNPKYWQKGLPYLDTLNFKVAANDESALEAMQAGGGQAFMYMTTPQLVKSFQSSFNVVQQETGAPYNIQVNTVKAPFNNKLAREALYYGANAATLDKTLFDDATAPVEGFTGPGGLFYHPTVPGYRTYDLAKAKAIVKQLGGLSFSIMAGQTGAQKTLAEGLQTMWQAAGMKVTLDLVDLPAEIQAFSGRTWQASVSTDGAFDPATGVAQMFRFLSTSTFSGVHDPKLDALLEKATQVPESQRGAVYQQIAEYESNQAYSVQLFPTFVWDIADKDVYAPGMTTVFPSTEDDPETWWQNAGYMK